MFKKLNSVSQWSDLPPEILHIIGELTGIPIYQTQFKAVCRSWRYAFVENRVINEFPIKIPYHGSLGFSCVGIMSSVASLFIVSTTSYVVQPVKGSLKGSSILVTCDEINPGYVSLRYPLSKSNCGFLGIGNECKSLDLLENRVMFVNPGFSLRLLHVRGNASKRQNGLNYAWRGESEKVVVLNNPCCESDLGIMVLCPGHKLMALRVRDGKWKAVFDGRMSKCVDIVKFRGKIYGIDELGRAFFVDYDFEKDDANIIMIVPSVKDCEGKPKRLVADSSPNGKLYMVVLKIKTRGSKFAFSVYSLNEDVQTWEKVRNIGNRMFFVGVNFSFCATARDFPGLAMSCMSSIPENCIFFGKGSFPPQSYGEDGDELLFKGKKEGIGMRIGQYYLGDKCATGILDPGFIIMFSHPI